MPNAAFSATRYRNHQAIVGRIESPLAAPSPTVNNASALATAIRATAVRLRARLAPEGRDLCGVIDRAVMADRTASR